VLDAALAQPVWGWIPREFFLTGQVQAYAGYSRGALLSTLALTVPLNWIAAPVVEELYFRATCCRASLGWVGGRRS